MARRLSEGLRAIDRYTLQFILGTPNPRFPGEWGATYTGDKGDSANVGVIARDPALMGVLRRELTAERVKGYFAHLVGPGWDVIGGGEPASTCSRPTALRRTAASTACCAPTARRI